MDETWKKTDTATQGTTKLAWDTWQQLPIPAVTCPTCGYCPTCGRRYGAPYWTRPHQTLPYWVLPAYTTPNTTGGIY